MATHSGSGDDSIAESEHVSTQVESVPVDRVPSGLELPGLVPPTKRRKTDAEKVGGLPDGEQIARGDLVLPTHEVHAIQR